MECTMAFIWRFQFYQIFEENTGGPGLRGEMGKFNEFIEDHDLLELEISGPRFTYSNNQNPPKSE